MKTVDYVAQHLTDGVLPFLGPHVARLVDDFRAAESALAAERTKHQDTHYQLGKAQGEAEGHALVRKGLEAELASKRARVVAAEAMVEDATELAQWVMAEVDLKGESEPRERCRRILLREERDHYRDKKREADQALARKGVEVELAAERARVEASEAMVEDARKLARWVAAVDHDHRGSPVTDWVDRILASRPAEPPKNPTLFADEVTCPHCGAPNRAWAAEQAKDSSPSGAPTSDGGGPARSNPIGPRGPERTGEPPPMGYPSEYQETIHARSEPRASVRPTASGGDSPAEPQELPQCPECDTQMVQLDDVTEHYETHGERAEWKAPCWVCPHCDLRVAGEHDTDAHALAMERMFARVIRKLETERDDLKRQLEEAKDRRDDDLAIMGQKLIDAQESHSKLFAQLEAAQASAATRLTELQQLYEAFQGSGHSPKNPREAAQAIAQLKDDCADPGELEHLREAARLLNERVTCGNSFTESEERWVRAEQKRAAPVAEECCGGGDLCYPDCDKMAAAQPSPAQEPADYLSRAESVIEQWGSHPDDNQENIHGTGVSRFCRLILAHLKQERADITAIVDARVAELAKAAAESIGETSYGWAMRKLAEAAEAGKASG